MSSNRSLLAIVAGVLTLVAVTVVVVLVAGDPKPQEFPRDSAEAAVQGYLGAWEDRDVPSAYAFLSERVRASTSLEDYQRAADDFLAYGMPPRGGERRLSIGDAYDEGDHVIVPVTVEELYGDGLNQTVNRSTRFVPMVRDADGWRIDEPLVWLDPMPFYGYEK
ncbi:MAG: hypothetical protein OEW24_10045 [Chloroflexota bacterium]|nr:hypothetical protein [Chloroflexota bacterium]